MLIGINGWYQDDPHVGLGQYTMSLVNGLSWTSQIDGLYVFVKANSITRQNGVRKRNNVHFIEIAARPFVHDLLSKAAFERGVLRAAHDLRCDVLHTPYLYSPPHKVPGMLNVATVHDVIHRVYPSYSGGRVRTLLVRRYEQRIQNLDAIISDSEFSARDIRRYIDVGDIPIRVIYPSVNPSFLENVPNDRLLDVRKKYALPEEFILYLGGFDFRKNVPALIKAYAKLVEEEAIRGKLVLAGKFAPSRKQLKMRLVDDVYATISDVGLGDSVVMIGFVDQSDLPALYKLASLFVYPSTYEGFGLPVLEAMACGTPILAGATSSIPEIVGREDLLFDPRNYLSISAKMQWVLSSSKTRDDISQWAVERASQFTWQSAIGRTLDLYTSVASLPGMGKR